MTREELTKLTAKELDQMCREKDLPRYKGKNHLNKTEMINNLLGTVKEEKEETKVEVQQEEALASESSNDDSYIEKAEVGTLIAFVDKKNLTRSGKIVEKDSEKRHITVELKSGRKFFITYDNVLWVTSEENRRWPKKILFALKESQQKIEEAYKNSLEITNDSLERLKNKMMGSRR